MFTLITFGLEYIDQRTFREGEWGSYFVNIWVCSCTSLSSSRIVSVDRLLCRQSRMSRFGRRLFTNRRTVRRRCNYRSMFDRFFDVIEGTLNRNVSEITLLNVSRIGFGIIWLLLINCGSEMFINLRVMFCHRLNRRGRLNVVAVNKK